MGSLQLCGLLNQQEVSFDQLDQLKRSNCSIASMETENLITPRYTMIITATICLITQNDHCFKIIVRFCYGFFASIIVHIVGNRTQIHHLVSSFFKYSSFTSLVNFIWFHFLINSITFLALSVLCTNHN